MHKHVQFWKNTKYAQNCATHIPMTSEYVMDSLHYSDVKPFASTNCFGLSKNATRRMPPRPTKPPPRLWWPARRGGDPLQKLGGGGGPGDPPPPRHVRRPGHQTLPPDLKQIEAMPFHHFACIFYTKKHHQNQLEILKKTQWIFFNKSTDAVQLTFKWIK